MYYFWSLVLFLLSMIFLIFILFSHFVVYLEFKILSFFSLEFMISIFLDKISFFFLFLVLIISSLVVLYSYNYMNFFYSKIKFLTLILLFVFMMLLVIISSNILTLMLGWDGLGVISYLLVVFFWSKKVINSGFITILSNRIGDINLIILISTMVNLLDHEMLFINMYAQKSMMWILLIIASMTKSAQIPFSAWLPHAMAAPTPVSSLVHSSTLVTAGVYLLVRNFSMIPSVGVIQMIGGLTSVMAGLSAIIEKDSKKIVALSTLSQMGLLFLSLGMGLLTGVMIHLFSHAFFKCLLFLCVGNLIHIFDSQDLGKSSYQSPSGGMTLSGALVGSFSLMGWPYLSGFYSKDLIFELSTKMFNSLLSSLIFLMSIFLTAIYSMKMINFLLLKVGAKPLGLMEEEKESSFAIFCLSILAISFTLLFSWMIEIPLSSDPLSSMMKISPLLMMFAGMILSLTNFINKKIPLVIKKIIGLDKLHMFIMLYIQNMMFNINLTETKILILLSFMKKNIMLKTPNQYLGNNWVMNFMMFFWLLIVFF